MNIFDDIVHHLLHYLLLAIILVGGFSSVIFLGGQKNSQIVVLAIVALSYFLWGLSHHYLTHKHFHLQIVVEYALVAFLGFILVRGIINL